MFIGVHSWFNCGFRDEEWKMTTEALPEIPPAVPFLECRLHPVTTRQFMRILAAAVVRRWRKVLTSMSRMIARLETGSRGKAGRMRGRAEWKGAFAAGRGESPLLEEILECCLFVQDSPRLNPKTAVQPRMDTNEHEETSCCAS